MGRTTLAISLLAALVLAVPAGATGFTRELPIPPELTGDHIEIHAAKTPVDVVGAPLTDMWTFNGTFPGPTIRRPAGAKTDVTFYNDLPAETGDLTIHHHGEHSASSDDGQPDDELIAPGSAKTYTYDLTEDGDTPERAAFQWYHDHRLEVTGRNVWNGLAGMFIVEDDFEKSLDLPTGQYDVPLMIVDRTLNPVTHQLAYPALAPLDAVTGDTILVNGVPQPYMNVSQGLYRLRLLNASNGRIMTFSLTGGQQMDQIATESGLLANPVPRAEVELGPAERAEVLVDFKDVVGPVMLRAGDDDILQFNVSGAGNGLTVPDALRPVPDLGTSTRNRSFNLGLVEDATHWAINGQTFDHLRTDAEPKLGSTETWTFNGGTGTHVVHIHGTDFRVLSRDDVAPPAGERGLKETVIVHPKEKVVVKLRFTDHLGAFVFHCHVLEHEDSGMMARYVVSATGDQPATPTPTPDPGTGSETGPPPATTAANSGTPKLALRWIGAPKRLGAGASAKPRLEVRSTGTADTPPGTLSIRLTGGLSVGRKHLKRLSLTLPGLAPGARKSFTVALRAPAKLRAATLSASLSGHRATVSYRLKGRRLRRAGATASAAGGFLCRLL